MPQIRLEKREEQEVKLDVLVAPLRADVVSGASVIGRSATDVVQRAVLGFPCDNTAAFREMLVTLSIKILEAQPAMAPLVAMASRILCSFQKEEELDAARTRVIESTIAFRRELEEAAGQIATQAGSLIPERATVLTLSSSSTVRRTLERYGENRSLRAICLESRPMAEGAQLARHLANAGLQVTYAIDAAAGTLIRDADLVLLGADSLGDGGVVNKVGSLTLVSVARGWGLPVYVLLDRSKLLPPTFPQRVKDDRPGDEVLKGAAGIDVWNRYFELVPTDAVTSIVTEDGVISPLDVEELRSRIPVPSELQAWANARSL